MLVRDICNRDFIYGHQGLELHSAVALMRTYLLDQLVIVDGFKPVGILNGIDILLKVTAENLKLSDFTVADVMQYEFVTLHEAVDLNNALCRMRDHGEGFAPVVSSQNHVIGILTAHDILDIFADELSSLAMLMRNRM